MKVDPNDLKGTVTTVWQKLDMFGEWIDCVERVSEFAEPNTPHLYRTKTMMEFDGRDEPIVIHSTVISTYTMVLADAPA